MMSHGRSPDPISPLLGGLSTPFAFLLSSIITLMIYNWSFPWFTSGTPALCYLILLGSYPNLIYTSKYYNPSAVAVEDDASNHLADSFNSLDSIPSVSPSSTSSSASATWTAAVLINLLWILTSTSWLFSPMYNALCYPAILVFLLLRSCKARVLARRIIQATCKETHYFADKFAVFRLPALDIDVDARGMMVVGGVTVSLSDLTLTVHGVEVGLKLMEGMDVAIRTEKVIVRLGRSIEIGDVYGNLKTDADIYYSSSITSGGATEQDDTPTGRRRASTSTGSSGFFLDSSGTLVDELAETQPFIDEGVDVRSDHSNDSDSTPKKRKINKKGTIDVLTDGKAPSNKIDSDTISGAVSQAKIATETHRVMAVSSSSLEDEAEVQRIYEEKVRYLEETSAISRARRRLMDLVASEQDDSDKESVHSTHSTQSVNSFGSFLSNMSSRSAERRKQREIKRKPSSELTSKEKKALMSSFLHELPSITHPPDWSISVSKLQSLTPWFMRLLARKCPWMLRLLLNMISHLHPVRVNGVIATGCGAFASKMLRDEVFKHHREESADVRRLACRVENWLETGNFNVQISKINGLAQVPVSTAYDINATVTTSTVQVFKVLLEVGNGGDNEIDAEGLKDRFAKKPLRIRDKEGLQKEAEDGISECARFGGVSATFRVPTMLMPHHEFLFPPAPASRSMKRGRAQSPVGPDVHVHEYENDRLQDGVKQDLNNENKKKESDEEEDYVNVSLALLASLPMEFNSTVLHFISALVKATKLVELQRNARAFDEEVRSIASWSKHVNTKIKDSLKKSLVANTVDDAWIARMVGKVLGAMEAFKGDFGYKMPIRVPLEERRKVGDKEKAMGWFD